MSASLIERNPDYLRISTNSIMQMNLHCISQYLDMELDLLMGLAHTAKYLRVPDDNFIDAVMLMQLVVEVIKPHSEELYTAMMDELRGCSLAVIAMRNGRLGIEEPEDPETMSYTDYINGAHLFIIGLSGVYPEGTSIFH